ncbi:MAG: hypothetical protein Q4A00_06645 [Flavobacteriaceae bacterium]|nr:hypothetical protein [Flavobacteriaceae bacterium]
MNHQIFKLYRNFSLSEYSNIITLFIDTTQNEEFSEFFSYGEWKKFKLGNEINPTKIKEVISYFCPFCSNEKLQSVLNELENPHRNFDQEFLDWLGYKGRIKTGFLRLAPNGILFTEVSGSDNIPRFYYKYENSFVFEEEIRLNKYLIESSLEDEAIQKIEEMRHLAQYFVESKQVFLLAPLIKELSQQIGFDLEPSRLKITSDFKVILLDYNQLEIDIRHLSKALYLTFLQNEKPIDLENLGEHKELFTQLYKAISYRNNLDVLESSIEAVLDVETKQVYQHISRIKSAFCSKISPSLAREYYIAGNRNQSKQIKLPRKLVIWEGIF